MRSKQFTEYRNISYRALDDALIYLRIYRILKYAGINIIYVVPWGVSGAPSRPVVDGAQALPFIHTEWIAFWVLTIISIYVIVNIFNIHVNLFEQFTNFRLLYLRVVIEIKLILLIGDRVDRVRIRIGGGCRCCVIELRHLVLE